MKKSDVNKTKHKTLSETDIILIIIAAFCLFIVVFIGFNCCRRRRHKRKPKAAQRKLRKGGQNENGQLLEDFSNSEESLDPKGKNRSSEEKPQKDKKPSSHNSNNPSTARSFLSRIMSHLPIRSGSPRRDAEASDKNHSNSASTSKQDSSSNHKGNSKKRDNSSPERGSKQKSESSWDKKNVKKDKQQTKGFELQKMTPKRSTKGESGHANDSNEGNSKEGKKAKKNCVKNNDCTGPTCQKCAFKNDDDHGHHEEGRGGSTPDQHGGSAGQFQYSGEDGRGSGHYRGESGSGLGKDKSGTSKSGTSKSGTSKSGTSKSAATQTENKFGSEVGYGQSKFATSQSRYEVGSGTNTARSNSGGGSGTNSARSNSGGGSGTNSARSNSGGGSGTNSAGRNCGDSQTRHEGRSGANSDTRKSGTSHTTHEPGSGMNFGGGKHGAGNKLGRNSGGKTVAPGIHGSLDEDQEYMITNYGEYANIDARRPELDIDRGNSRRDRNHTRGDEKRITRTTANTVECDNSMEVEPPYEGDGRSDKQDKPTSRHEASRSGIDSAGAVEKPKHEGRIESIGEMYNVMQYARSEWKSETATAKTVRNGYFIIPEALGLHNLRVIRGDNYCAIRATLFQVLAKKIPFLHKLQDIEKIPQRLMASRDDFIDEWTFGSRIKVHRDNVPQELGSCLRELSSLVDFISGMDQEEGRISQLLINFNFKPFEIEIRLLEAVKFLMLYQAIQLHKEMKANRDVPIFAMIMFARDSSEDPHHFMIKHLNAVGDTGGLEQVEMHLLGYTFGVTIKVVRPSHFGQPDFIASYPEDMPDGTPVVALVAEDDRHYNILS